MVWDSQGHGFFAQASFKVKVSQIRERMHLKESESSGEWLTEERMGKSGEYGKLLDVMIVVFARPLNPIDTCKQPYLRQTIKSIIAFCDRFPQILTRPWFMDVPGYPSNPSRPCTRQIPPPPTPYKP